MRRTRPQGSGGPACTRCRTSAPSALADPAPRARRTADRPRSWVVGLSLFLVLAVGLVVWLTHQESTYHAPLDGRPPQTIDEQGATTLLDSLQAAVRRGDVAGGARLGGTPFERTDLRGVVHNARTARVTDFSL